VPRVCDLHRAQLFSACMISCRARRAFGDIAAPAYKPLQRPSARRRSAFAAAASSIGGPAAARRIPSPPARTPGRATTSPIASGVSGRSAAPAPSARSSSGSAVSRAAGGAAAAGASSSDLTAAMAPGAAEGSEDGLFAGAMPKEEIGALR
jgi:hypothetical protein